MSISYKVVSALTDEIEKDPAHGSPADRGSADAYYGRPEDPHYWPQGTYNGTRVEAKDMTALQIQEYLNGYYNETDRKSWD